MWDLVNPIYGMTFSRHRVEHFIHVSRIDIGIYDNNIICEKTWFRCPHGVGNSAREIHEGHFSRNDRHVTDAVRRAEDPLDGKPELFQFPVNLSAFDQSRCCLSLMDGHPHVGEGQNRIPTMSNRVYLQDRLR
jgi:hypothetical protein